MKKRLAWIMAAALILAVFAAGCGARGGGDASGGGEGDGTAKYTIRMAYDVSETHASHLAAEEVFVPMVEEGSNGEIKVELYPNSQLGSVPENIESMRMGGLEMCWASDAAIAGFVPEWNLVGLPFLWTSIEAAQSALDGDFGDHLDQLLEDQCGIIDLANADVGFRNITNSKHEIRTPEDLKGIKIRTMTNTLHVEYFTDLGAIPTPMSFSELFTALQQKTVDAQENPTSMIWNNKLYEVQDYLTVSEHVWSSAPIIIAKDYYESLPEEYQTLIADAAQKTMERQREIITQQNADYVQNIADAGLQVTELTAEEKAAFQKIAQEGVYKTAAETYGQELIDMAAAHNK